MTTRTAWAMPVLPGKTDQLRNYMNELKGPRRQEGLNFGKKYNLTREVDFLQHTPQGDFFIATWEGDDLEKFMRDSIKNPDEYTKWNMQQMQEITGAEPPKEGSTQEWPLPEMIVDTGNTVSGNGKISAFAAPILPGKYEEWKQFTDELKGNRKQDFNDLHSKNNVRERTYFQPSPEGQGGIVIVTLEGENPEGYMNDVTQGTGEFNKWFVQKVQEVHGFNLAEVAQQPLPEMIFDTKELEKEPALAS